MCPCFGSPEWRPRNGCRNGAVIWWRCKNDRFWAWSWEQRTLVLALDLPARRHSLGSTICRSPRFVRLGDHVGRNFVVRGRVHVKDPADGASVSSDCELLQRPPTPMRLLAISRGPSLKPSSGWSVSHARRCYGQRVTGGYCTAVGRRQKVHRR